MLICMPLWESSSPKVGLCMRQPKKLYFIFFVLFSLFSSGLFAQQRAVSGKVTDQDNKPVAGATVSVQGSNIATQTNPDGSFSITVSNRNAELVISFVGLETRRISVGDQSNI